MPLRTLLGYEPRTVSRQGQEYGRQFVSAYSPVRPIMASKKVKYQVPMARVKKLPPIDEETSSLGSPRHRRREATVRRLPKKMFSLDDLYDEEPIIQRPVRHKPTMAVSPMSRRRSPDLDIDYKQYSYIKPQLHVQHQHVTPKDVNHTLVDGLVADYLHYSRYGHVIPVYEGTSSNSCPCCTDRNRQNVRTLLGFPKDYNPNQPTKYDNRSTVKNTQSEKELMSDKSLYPNSMFASVQRERARKQPSVEERQRMQIAEESRRGAWVNYQPLPYATNYLNPEFNRPAELNSLYDVESHNNNLYMKHKVLEADSNFDNAMSKLNTYTYDRRY